MKAEAKARPKQWSAEEKQRLARLAKRGASAFEASAALGRHIASIRKMAREMKLVLRKPTKYARQRLQGNQLLERADRAIAESKRLADELSRSMRRAREIDQQLKTQLALRGTEYRYAGNSPLS